ncbi:MAG: DUF4258 domain-containing protein [Anaerolineae bacterium]|nr:DUF4258 domain-containing protein [Anaerolineae bacterium]
MHHTMRQMARPERMIAPEDVLAVISHGEVIEDYPEDARGHSCLILGFDMRNRPVHVVCAPKDEYLAIITAYIPERALWSSDFRQRVI